MFKTCNIILLALSVSGCGGGVSAGSGAEESGAQGALAGVVYQLRTLAHVGSCMDVNGAGTANGTRIPEWTCNGTAAQSFAVDDLGGGWSRIVNTNSNKCVDAYANATADGTNIQLYDCNGSGAQAWQFVDVGNGNVNVRIVGKTSGKCIDVFKSLTADGTNVQLWTCNGGNCQTWNQASINGNASRHQQYGEEILDKLNAKFYESATGLYVNAIDANQAQTGGTSYLWPTAHMMRALMWGALVNPGKYGARLHSFVGNVERYRDTTVSGYSSTANGKGDRYYDDNAQLGNALTDVYQKLFAEQAILNQSIVAFRSCINGRDSDWSIPQLDSSRGIMFTMSVTPTALNASKLAEIGGAADYASIASKYYSMFTDPTVDLRESNLLFGQGSRDTNGVWTEIGGLRAYQTAYVGQLAVELYATTHQAAYLNYAAATRRTPS